jgi:hypothetical protein
MSGIGIARGGIDLNKASRRSSREAAGTTNLYEERPKEPKSSPAAGSVTS